MIKEALWNPMWIGSDRMFIIGRRWSKSTFSANNNKKLKLLQWEPQCTMAFLISPLVNTFPPYFICQREAPFCVVSIWALSVRGSGALFFFHVQNGHFCFFGGVGMLARMVCALFSTFWQCQMSLFDRGEGSKATWAMAICKQHILKRGFSICVDSDKFAVGDG